MPIIFYYIMKYITPLYLLILIIAWTWQQGISVISMDGVKPEEIFWKWGARIMMLGIIVVLIISVRTVCKRKDSLNKKFPK